MMRRQSVIYLKDACASIGFWVQGHLVVTSLPVAVIMPGGYWCPCFFMLPVFGPAPFIHQALTASHSQGSEIGIHTTQTRREPILGGSSAASLPQRVCSA